jgi:hypothetical protein
MGRNPLRTCKECSQIKPHSEFPVCKECYDGIRPVCKECLYAKKKSRIQKPENYNKARASQRNSYLKKTFGITSEGYEELLKKAGGCCEVCGKTETYCRGKLAYFVVDHCHTTGEIRGILCHSCNRAIGQLGDSSDLVDKARRYLLRFEEK